MNGELFQKGLARLGAEASSGQMKQFADYSALLKEWNEKMNLTGRLPMMTALR